MNCLTRTAPLLALCIALPAWAGDLTAEEIMSKMDDRLNGAEDLYLHYEVVHQDPGNADPRMLEFEVHVKDEKKLTHFLAPADQKGTKVLILDPKKMYVWLPQFSKMRRISSGDQERGFMGTVLSSDDMSVARYSPLYSCEIASESDAAWELACTPRPDADNAHPKLEFTVSKELTMPTEIRYYDSKGELARTETRKDYTCDQDFCTFTTMRMTDHTANDTWTELRRVEWKLNEGIPDDMFTVRALQRGY